MEIEIKKLSPALIEDYVNFFDETPHDDNVDENKCYCVCWCSADHRVDTDFSSRAKRRALAVQYIQSGLMQGYLAYCGEQVIGWCNANTKADCLHCTSWLRFMQSFSDADLDNACKIKSVFCFVIAPAWRRKGIAKLLLDRVCEDAAKEGFDCVEAYPMQEFVNESRDFMGPKGLYEKTGFDVCRQVDNRLVMRKRLTDRTR